MITGRRLGKDSNVTTKNKCVSIIRSYSLIVILIGFLLGFIIQNTIRNNNATLEYLSSSVLSLDVKDIDNNKRQDSNSDVDESIEDNTNFNEQDEEKKRTSSDPEVDTSGSNTENSYFDTNEIDNVDNESDVKVNNDNPAEATTVDDSENPQSEYQSSHGLSCDLYGGPYTKEAVEDEMVYWYDIPEDNQFVSPLKHPTIQQYFTIEPDEGGWNNIRMAFETALGIAIMTGRTFVLPPKMNFYLLWFGTNQSDNTIGFDSFYPIDNIKQEHSITNNVHVITFEEFVTTVIDTGKILDPLTGESVKPPFQLTSTDKEQQVFSDFHNNAAARKGDGQKLWTWFRSVTTVLEWNYDTCVAVFPNKPGTESVTNIQSTFNAATSRDFNNTNYEFSNESIQKWSMDANQRISKYQNNPTSVVNPNWDERLAEMITVRTKLCIYDEFLQTNATVVHGLGQQDTGYRLLVHYYAFLFFENYNHDLWYKRFVRDHLRYIDIVQCAAARIIEKLRQYSFINSHGKTTYYHSMHIRRGDFQYKDMRSISAEDIYELNTKNILPANSTLFIATDETDFTFFQPLIDHYHVYFLSNFINPDDTNNYVINENINKNYYGMIDQLVASKGDIFFGAYYSTFTGYINRLRGYWTQKQKVHNWELGLIEKSYFYGPEKIIKRFQKTYHTYSSIHEPFWAREFPIAWRDINHNIEKK